MPPIEVAAPSATSAITRLARNAGGDSASSAAASTANATVATTASTAAAASVQTSSALDAGSVPVDQDRVSQIRDAIRSGNYPLVPAKIGDAMIAAGMFLRSA